MSPRSFQRRKRSGIRPDDVILGAIIGVGATYYGLVAHTFEHPWHWLVAGGGGLVGGVGVWLHAERHRLGAGARRLFERGS